MRTLTVPRVTAEGITIARLGDLTTGELQPGDRIYVGAAKLTVDTVTGPIGGVLYDVAFTDGPSANRLMPKSQVWTLVPDEPDHLVTITRITTEEVRVHARRVAKFVGIQAESVADRADSGLLNAYLRNAATEDQAGANAIASWFTAAQLVNVDYRTEMRP